MGEKLRPFWWIQTEKKPSCANCIHFKECKEEKQIPIPSKYLCGDWKEGQNEIQEVLPI